MGKGVRLFVRGEYACFTRPEMKVERVTYDVMTPSAAKGVLDCIYWKPSIRWRVTAIHVLNDIRFASIRRNEVSSVVSPRNVRRAMETGDLSGLPIQADDPRERAQRASTVLRDVAYVIEAEFDMRSGDAGEGPAKHLCMFRRRASRGQCAQRPFLGTREFAADFRLLEHDEPLPAGTLPAARRDQDLGWMLLGIDFHDEDPARGVEPRFFRAKLDGGTLHVPPMGSVEARS